MERTLVVLARGCAPVRNRCSTSVTATPRMPSSIASDRPTGPAPTTSTSVWMDCGVGSSVRLGPDYAKSARARDGARPQIGHPGHRRFLEN